MIRPFNFSSIPKIIFGPGKLNNLYELISNYGDNVLLVIGGSSLKKSGKWDEITITLDDMDVNYYHISLSGEPSPKFIDNYAFEFRKKKIDLVVGIGGGSVTDTGKAISAMIPQQDSIKNYIEGIGNKIHDGSKIPYIAIPTTSGTGSEATKNAVISEVGPNGFKKSLRHDNLIPDIAIIDPELMVSCPSSISAACGMDAFTQLLESYVSPTGSPITDALAYSGMKYIKDNIIPACSTGAKDINVRSGMAYGSLISGITLANAGLGIVHGLASPIGGFFKIPHGVVCGTLLIEATKINIEALKKQGASSKVGLKKYAKVGALLNGNPCFEDNEILRYCEELIKTLETWIESLRIDRLSKYGISEDDVDYIVKSAGLKNNPVKLSEEDIKKIVVNRI